MGEVQIDRRDIGARAEEIAAGWLRSEGYRILARNFSCREGELDLVAEKDGVICFVEVRMRASAEWGDPAHTISRTKQRKVVRAALYYLYYHRIQDRMLRFDVISIVGRGVTAEVEHLPGAFDAGM